jgi:hypothetical protein
MLSETLPSRPVCWIRGANMDNNELDDSSLVVTKASGHCFAISAVRACSCRCPYVESKDWP